MIVRPQSDGELIERAREILSDPTVQLDTRAMIALLILSKDRATCPVKSEIALMLGGEAKGEAIGAERMQRMIRNAKRMRARHRPIVKVRDSAGKSLGTFKSQKAGMAAISSAAAPNG